MTIALSDVATRKDVANELGGDTELDRLCNDSADVMRAMALALEEVLYSLRGRTPPIYEGDVADPTELRRVVALRAAARMHFANMTTGGGDDICARKHSILQKQYESELASLRPTVGGAIAAPAFSIPMHRR